MQILYIKGGTEICFEAVEWRVLNVKTETFFKLLELYLLTAYS
jgi:hypothetical protein